MNGNVRLLLINPTAPQWRVAPGTKPTRRSQAFRFSMLSSLYVAAAMPPNVRTQILDEDVEPIDFETNADLIGISFMTFNAPHAYEIADRFRREKGKTVILGGYHPSFMPEEAIQHADSICIGEAERIAPLMIEDFLSRRLKQFYRNRPVDLRGLPAPDRNLIRKNLYALPDTVQATRGCPYRCSFCSITSFFGHTFRMRPVNEVIGELKLLGKYLLFMDDNIAANPAYAKSLFASMIPLKKRWFSQCGVGIVYDDELLRLAYESGCRGLFIGLESLLEDNLRYWNKTCNKARDYRWAIEKLHKTGIAVVAGIVFGNDWDTPEVFPRTLEFLQESRVDALQATILTPFPGTPLFDEMDRNGRITDKDWGKYDFRHVVFEPRNMSPQALKDGHDWVLSNFYSRRSVVTRLLNEFRYLSPATIVRGSGPVNLSYRYRLNADGTFGSV